MGDSAGSGLLGFLPTFKFMAGHFGPGISKLLLVAGILLFNTLPYYYGISSDI